MANLKPRILAAAVRLARSDGLENITRDGVATAAKAAMGSVNYHFGSIDKLRDAVVDHALKHQILDLLAAARARRHPRLRGRLTPELKARLANSLLA